MMLALDWSKTRILLVHGDIHVRRWAHDVLHKRKVAGVQSTRSPATGLDLLKRFAADAAIVQLQHPEMSALEFARRLDGIAYSTRQPPAVIVIADTPGALPLDQAGEAGIAGVVNRPMTPETFLEGIAAALASRPATPGAAADRRPASGRRPFGPAEFAAPAAERKPEAAAEGPPPALASPAPAAAPSRPAVPLVEPAAKRAPLHGVEDWAAALAPTAMSEPVDAGPEIDPILADHAAWLSSHGGEGCRAVLDGIDLHGRSLVKVNLAGAGLRGADLTDADCRHATLASADLRRADLSAADLTGANLSVANLRGARLRLAKLAETSLRGADLAGACLSDAVLAGADFAGANLLDTDLRQSDLTWAIGLTQPQVDKARADMSTRMPIGIRLPDPAE